MVSSSGRMPVERVGFVALIFAAVLYLSGGSGGTGGYASARQLDEVQLSLSGTNGAPFPGHILVTGGAGFIGSHATLRLLEDGYAVTIVDNYSRGNRGAIETLRKLAPRHKLRVVDGDLGVTKDLERAFGKHKVDAVIHFAAIAYVGESVSQPLAYYRNVTVNTVGLLEAMKRHDVRKLVYSSTCATYGNPDVLPITEKTPTVPINPYGKSKLYSEDAIRDYAVANKGKFILMLVRAISMMTLCFDLVFFYQTSMPPFCDTSTCSDPTHAAGSASSRGRSYGRWAASAARVSTRRSGTFPSSSSWVPIFPLATGLASGITFTSPTWWTRTSRCSGTSLTPRCCTTWAPARASRCGSLSTRASVSRGWT